MNRRLNNLRITLCYKPVHWFKMQMSMRTLANDPKLSHLIVHDDGFAPIQWVLDRIYGWFYTG